MILFFQVGRVGGSNKIFERLLDLETLEQKQSDSHIGLPASVVQNAQMLDCGGVLEADSLRSELEMAKQCGQYINSAVESWLSDKAAPISPTMPEILSVVAKAVSSMPLPNREDLLNFQNFVEAESEAKIYRFLNTEKLHTFAFSEYLTIICFQGHFD